ncbi:MAG TPA: YggU family protein [Chloroflexi bacterium]|nr:YggU family protein [Chloroflexota bacterium]
METGAWTVVADGEGARFAVRVVPRAKRSEVMGVQGEALKVRVAAPPVEGKANEALRAFLAERLGLRRQQVEIVAGHRGRRKVVRVQGLSPRQVRERLLGPEAPEK